MFNRQQTPDLGAALDDIRTRLEKLEVILLVKDPGASRSAEAYEGLRRQISNAARSRGNHVAQLAEMDHLVATTDGSPVLGEQVRSWLAEAGVDRIDQVVDDPELFQVHGAGEHLIVLRPAYRDKETGVIVRQGHIEARDLDATDAPPTAASRSAEEPV